MPLAKLQDPVLATASTNDNPGGNGSLTTTPRATEGPALLTDKT